MAVLVNVVGKYNDADIAKARRALEGLGKTSTEASAKASGGFKKMGAEAKLALGAATAGLLLFGKQSIASFAEQQDAASALEATYKGTGAALIAWSEKTGDALNLSRKESEQAALTFANFGSAAGLTGKKLEQFTTPLIERAADAASYFGGTTADAIEAFGAAMRGEMEPIRRYGVLLDDATLRNKAFEMGLISSTKNALTPQQKTLAAQALILEKTAKVQGDVARTSDSMANRIKDAQQQMEDFKTSTGETLAVAVGPLLGALNKGMATFNGLPQPVKTGAVAVGILGTAAVVAVPKIIALRTSLQQIPGASAKAAAGMKGAGKAAGALAAAMALGSLVNDFSKSEVNAGQSAEQLAKSLQRLSSGSTTGDVGLQFKTFTGRVVEFDEALGLVRDNHWWDQLEGGIAGMLNVPSNFNLASDSVKQLDAALAGMVDSGNALAAEKAFERTGISVEELATLLPTYAQSLKNVEPPTKAVAKATNAQADALKAVNTAFSRLQGLLDKGAAKDAWVTALKDIGDQAKEAKGKLLGPSDAALTLRGNLRSSIGDLQAYADGFTNPVAKAKVLRSGIAQIRESLIKNGIKPKDADAFLAEFSTIADKAYADAKGVGKNVALGLSEGIAKNRAQAIAEAKSLGKAAVRAVRLGADVASPSKYTYWVGQEVVHGLTKGVVDKAGGAKQIIKDATSQALSGADQVLDGWRAKGQQVVQFIDGIRGNVQGFGSVAGFDGSGRGTLSGPVTAGDVTGQMGAKVKQAQDFAKQVESLRRLHLNNASLQEIISAGPVAGGQIAKALLAGGRAAIGQVNSLEAQLGRAAASIGDTAGLSQYGMNRAQGKALASVSVKVEKGAVVLALPDGIRASDRKAIEDRVDDLFDKLADKLIRELGSDGK